MPAGRLPIQTVLLSSAKRVDVMQRVLTQAAEGAQAYWVCPKIEAAEGNGRISAEAIYQQLLEQQSSVAIGLLHGRMAAEDKSRLLQQFADGEMNILVSTVVIEVGVHVPNATIMVIDSAQSFGMAQLHQLRGRVGRASKQGYCMLLYDANLTVEAKQRLETVRQCHDGFALAEQDLAQRGPGDVCGTLQAGCPPWRLLSWPQHADLLQQTQQHLDRQPLTQYEIMLVRALWQ
jgi:ATP-dependent DNA helicase RecG